MSNGSIDKEFADVFSKLNDIREASIRDIKSKTAATREQISSTTKNLIEINRHATMRELLADSAPINTNEVKRIQQILANNDGIKTLTSKERNLVIRGFESFEPKDVSNILDSFPQCEKKLLKAVLRSELIVSPEKRAIWLQIFSSRHGSMKEYFSNQQVDVGAFLNNPPQYVADAGKDIANASDLNSQLFVEKFALKPTWPICVHATLIWLQQRTQLAPSAICDFWDAIRHDVIIESKFLPRKSGAAARSRFSASELVHVESSPKVLATVLGLALATRGESPEVIDVREKFKDCALTSPIFGDPRITSESLGWQSLKRDFPAVYDNLQQEFVRADLELFFNHIADGTDGGERKEFWRRYLKSIRKSIIVCTPRSIQQLRDKFSHIDDPVVKQSLKSAFEFLYQDSDNANAFILFFDRFVVAEFSKTGLAAVVVQRSKFDETFDVKKFRCFGNAKDLQNTIKEKMAHERILHHINWQYSWDNKLKATFGVFPERV